MTCMGIIPKYKLINRLSIDANIKQPPPKEVDL